VDLANHEIAALRAALAEAERKNRACERALCPGAAAMATSGSEHIRVLEARVKTLEEERDLLIAGIERWREGRAHLGVPMTYVDQRLVDESRTCVGNMRAARAKP
jgi:hypothetical protein